MTVTVTDVPERNRFEMRDGDTLVGLAEYHLYHDEVAILHTEIGDEFGGRGLGGQLVQAVMDDARAKGRKVLPYCPFTRAWLRKHPDYADLVPETHRQRFGL
ncbi:MAG TPA: GNAT family N-acetyltransferase [Pseudonocardiaceae bacterium]|jgi:predicted GNAT family acetyltransferase|nr:GNAT family N-acetyltransferase [Pseudonocardiaceae bacterium]